ncbi:hypothetical protein QR680_003653 [Steinernema hermaphroditum]|uniref:Uncharacterized protein n=1 Tax=Steinernema hermaphroditum TaxID=289476 RepID=A0AA39LSP8_9BILA|nr:hypothetical protein QR680_003653 [Steinernema hermaphroditum]
MKSVSFSGSASDMPLCGRQVDCYESLAPAKPNSNRGIYWVIVILIVVALLFPSLGFYGYLSFTSNRAPIHGYEHAYIERSFTFVSDVLDQTHGNHQDFVRSFEQMLQEWFDELEKGEKKRQNFAMGHLYGILAEYRTEGQRLKPNINMAIAQVSLLVNREGHHQIRNTTESIDRALNAIGAMQYYNLADFLAGFMTRRKGLSDVIHLQDILAESEMYLDRLKSAWPFKKSELIDHLWKKSTEGKPGTATKRPCEESFDSGLKLLEWYNAILYLEKDVKCAKEQLNNDSESDEKSDDESEEGEEDDDDD